MRERRWTVVVWLAWIVVAMAYPAGAVEAHKKGRGWQPNVEPFESMPGAGSPRVAVAGTEVHVALSSCYSGTGCAVGYGLSTDAGGSWYDPPLLILPPAACDSPCYWGPRSIAAAGPDVHITGTYRDHGVHQVFYVASHDGGQTLGRMKRMTRAARGSTSPEVAVAGIEVHLVFEQPGLPYRIYYRRSTDSGAAWGARRLLSATDLDAESPTIAVVGRKVFVAWTRGSVDASSGPDTDIYMVHSRDGGSNWSTPVEIAATEVHDSLPRLAATGASLQLAWMTIDDGKYAVWHRRSTDDGQTWSAPVRLSKPSKVAIHPDLAVNGKQVHVVWNRGFVGSGEVFYRSSANTGASWGARKRLSAGGGFAAHVAAAGSRIHVLYEERSDAGGFTVGYRRRDLVPD